MHISCSDKFTQAIAIDPNNHVLYSNRSAVYSAMSDYQKALDDANKATEIKPDWAKGWTRKGAAARGLGDLRKFLSTSYFPKKKQLLTSCDSWRPRRL